MPRAEPQRRSPNPSADLRRRIAQAKASGNVPRTRRLQEIGRGRQQRAAIRRTPRTASREVRQSAREEYKATRARAQMYGRVERTFKGRKK